MSVRRVFCNHQACLLSRYRVSFAVLALILSLLGVAGGGAFATPTDLGTANPYNVFVFGNDTQSNSDTQGRIAAGGNATFSGFDVAGSIGSGTTLVVGGTLTTTYGQVHGSLITNGAVLLHGPTVSGNVAGNSSVTFDQYGTVSGSVKYGTTYNKSTTTVNGTATQGTTALPFSFSAAQSELQGISSYCQNLPANGTTTISYGGITLTGTKSDLNVFSVSGTSLASATSLTINAPGGSTVLVNVSGSSGQMQNFGISINGTNRQYVLFSFAQATSLTFNSISVEGSVLAPQAAVNFAGGNLNGTLVAGSLSGPGQSNNYPFLGNLTPNAPSSPVLVSLALSPTTVTGGTNSTGTVTISAAAPSGGATVSLSSNTSAAAVPSGGTVTVAAGSTTATFPVTTASVSSTTTATISASYGGVTKPANLTITAASPVLTSVTLSPTGVTGGATSAGTVTLSSAAPAGGVTVSLSSDSTSLGVTVPASATVAAGSTTGTFSVATTPVTSTVTATITGVYGATKTATLIVSPAPITLTNLTVNPTTVIGGHASTGTVTISRAAPSGGLSVALSSDKAASGVTVPGTVLVASGATTAVFSISTTLVPSDMTAVITGVYGATKTANLIVKADTPPSVTLTSPSSGQVFAAPGTIALAATATDSDGTITKVEFYRGSTLISTATSAPYTYSWTGVAAGTYVLTAKAYDNDGLTATSTPVTIKVNALPTVTITAPADGASTVAPGSFQVAATASDSDGTIAKVDFYQNGVLIGTATSAPYTISWTGIAAGSYTLTAIATDNDGGAATSAPVHVTVAANTPPTVTLTAPADGSTYLAPATISLAATASDSDGTITKVEFYQGTTLLGTSTSAPYTSTWTKVLAGTYVITAKAYDNGGLTATSNSATVTVNTLSILSVAISPSPVVGGNTSQGTVTLNAVAPSDTSVTLSSGQPATVSTSVTVLAGQRTATFNVTTVAVASDITATITATYNGTATAQLVVMAPTLTSFTVVTPVIGGNPSVGTVTISSPAPASGLTVALSSDNANAQAPISVTVPAGQTTATFSIPTSVVASNVTANITATLGTVTKTKPLLITAPSLSSFTVVTPVVGGYASSGTVTISSPAPGGGLTITLTNDASAAHVPITVTIAAGSTSATFPIPTDLVNLSVVAHLTAAVNGVTLPATLTIMPLSILSVSVNPTSVVGGASSQGTVTLSAVAPSDLTVALLSNKTEAAIPASVTVLAGQNSATFTITTSVVAADVTATITGTYHGTTTVLLPIHPYQVAALSLAPDTVFGTQASTGTVTLNANAPTGGIVLHLGSGSPAATVPGTVTVLAGTNTATFPLTTVGVTVLTQALITASSDATSKSATLTINPPGCTMALFSSITLTADDTTIFGVVTLANPAGPGGEVVNLSSSDATALNVPSSVLVPENSAIASFTGAPLSVMLPTVVSVSGIYHGIRKLSNTQTIYPSPVVGAPGIPGPDGSSTAALDTGGLTLTPEAIARGFKISNLATFPRSFYPCGAAVTNAGTVLVGGFLGNGIYVLPNDMDGQTPGPAQYVGNAAFSVVTVDGEHLYANRSQSSVVQLNADGTDKAGGFQIGAGSFDIAVNPVNGHIITDGGDDIDPVTGTHHYFGGDGDGVCVSNDGKTAYFAEGRVYGIDIATGNRVFQTGALAHTPDGLATGSGSLTGYIYANNNDGTVTEINLLTGQETVIASGGGRGDLAKVDQTNGSFLVGQNGPDVPAFGPGFASGIGHLVRITPPFSGSFGAAVGRQVYVRDDIGHIDPTRKVTQTYSTFTADNSKTITDSREATGFDLTGISGLASQGTMQRSGTASFQTTGTFDLQWGIRSIVNPSLASYSSAGVAVDLLPRNPYSYTLAWPLGSVYLADISHQLNSVYHTLLTDQISSTCGTYQFADQPQQNWPAQKNTLSLVVAHPQNLLTGVPGRSLDMTLAGQDAPPYGTWDIVSLGTAIASSGNPLGWDVEPDHTSFGGFIVTVPASAPVGVPYEVRSTLSGAVGSAAFTTQPIGSSLTAPVLLPLTLSSRMVTGGASATVQIALDAPAPLGGATVSLSSSDSSVSIQPAFVIVTSGHSTAAATVQTSSVPTATVVTITASYNGTRTADLVILNADGIDTGGVDPGPGSGLGGTTLSGGQSGSGDGKTVGTPGLGSGTIIGTLPAPTNLRAVGGDGIVTLTWNADPTHQVKRYNVGRSQTKGGPYALIFRGLTQPGYVDQNVVNGQTYFYVVNAVSALGESSLSNEASATPVGIPLADPTITPNGGVITAGTLVTLADATFGAGIYYTTDGSEPTTSSLLYTAPFPVSDILTVQAKAFKTGLAPSRTVSAEFVIATAFPGTVTITAPATGTALVVGDSVPVTAIVNNPSTPSVTFTALDFYANGVLIGHIAGDQGTISWTPTVPGTYHLSAHALSSDGAQKLFSPSVFVTVTLPLAGTTLDCGQIVSGALTTSDATSLALHDGQFADRYTFQGIAGETVILSLSSTNFDGYLALFDPNGTQVAANDDSLGQTNNSQIIYQIPVNGTYTVEATSYSPGQTGPYTLGLRCSPSGAAGQLSVSVDGTSIANNGSVDFGSTPQSVPVTKTLVLTNTGNADLAIIGMTGSGDWTPGSLGQNVISPGQSTTLTLRFNATNPGGASGTLVLGNTTAVNPYTINLTGTVTAALPAVSVIGLSFAPTAVVGGTSTQATITLGGNANPGGQLINFSSANTGIIPTPVSITVPAGQSTSNFALATNPVNSAARVTVSAFIGTRTAPQSFVQARLVVSAPGSLPSVTLTAPFAGATFTAPATITLAADAHANVAGVTITKVEFFNGTTKLGEALASPYTLSWPSVGVGDYVLTAVATDSNGLTGTSAPIQISVNDHPTVPDPTITPNGGTITTGSVSVSLSDTLSGATIFYTTDGSTPTLNSLIYTHAFILTSNTTVRAIAAFPGDNASGVTRADFVISNTGTAPSAPTATITSPTDGSEVTTVTSINGIAASSALAYWQLDYQYNGTDVWTPFASGTASVNNGLLGKLDTTLLLNGQYTIRLTSVDTFNQVSQDEITLVIKGNQKIGYETLTYTDLTIPVAGISISITRTYDSRNKTGGDFGVGWTLGYNSIKLQKSGGAIGDNWIQQKNGGGFSQYYSVTPSKAKLVTITMPDGTIYNFAASLNPSAQSFYPLDGGTVIYTALPGTKGTLQVLGSMDVLTSGTSGPIQLLDLGGDDETGDSVLDRHQFLLTTRDGRQFQINDTDRNSGVPTGLQYIRDLNGNQLDFSSQGIKSSFNGTTGKSILFDYAGSYISGITDLNGHTIHYSTDAVGNLVSAIDRVGNTTTYDYDYQHYLTAVHDSLGHTPLRNFYLPNGRLDYSLDAHDKRVDYYYDQGLDSGSRLPQASDITGLPTIVPAGGEITTDRLGHPTEIIYDNYGNISSFTRYLILPNHTARPIKTTLTFNPNDPYNPDKPLSITTPLGNENVVSPSRFTTSYTYDTQGNLITITDPLGNKRTTTYDGYGNILTSTDALGQVVNTNSYDSHGNLIQTKDALGNTNSYIYNSQGIVQSFTDAKGIVTHYDYDPNGNLLAVVDGLGHTTRFTYDANGNKLSQTTNLTSDQSVIETVVTLSEYDANGRITKTIAPDGGITQTTYNSFGKVDSIRDPLGFITTHAYDDYGQLSQINYSDTTAKTIKYDDGGQCVFSTIDKSGRGEIYTYDSLGRRVTTTPVDTQGHPYLDIHGNLVHSSIAYDDNNREVSLTNENTNTVTQVYDDSGRVISVVDALGYESKQIFNAAGYQTAAIDANGNATTFSYDAAGRLLATYYPDGTVTTAIYDELGRKIAQTDQANKTTTYNYDQLGRLILINTQGGNHESYRYDELGNKVSQTDANGHTTRFSYNSRGQMTGRTLPLGQIENRSYDLDGRLITSTDFNGKVTTYAYDTVTGLPISKTPDPTLGQQPITFSYNSDTTLAVSSYGNVTTSYQYDAHGLLHQVTNPSGTISYTYDSAGNTTEIQTPSHTISYGYDADNRLIAVTHNDGTVTQYTYDKVGNRVKLIRGNGVITNYTYDKLNRLTDVINSYGSSYHYTLARDGKRISVTKNSGTTYYNYDDDGHLTKETTPITTANYIYDLVGNRLQKIDASGTTTYDYDANDRLISEHAPSHSVTNTYDANGNQTQINGQQATYDFENRLISLGSSRNPTVTYTYDADGNRITAASISGQAKYLVDTQLRYPSVVKETDGSGNVINYDYGDDLIRMDRSDGIHYYIFDGLGSATALTNSTATYSYDAFGNLVNLPTDNNNFLFNGQQLDQSSGLYYLRSRFYDQTVGRFISQDPYLGNDDNVNSLHRYLYASADPINRIDPGGQLDGTLASVATTIGIWAMSNTPLIFNLIKAGATAAIGFINPDAGNAVAMTMGPEAQEGAALAAEARLGVQAARNATPIKSFAATVFHFIGVNYQDWTYRTLMPARWNPLGQEALYTALDYNTMFEEFKHYAPNINPPNIAKFTTLDVNVPNVLDLTDPVVRAHFDPKVLAYALNPNIDASTNIVGHAIGEEAEALGFQGLIVPSVRSGGNNLIMIGNQIIQNIYNVPQFIGHIRHP